MSNIALEDDGGGRVVMSSPILDWVGLHLSSLVAQAGDYGSPVVRLVLQEDDLGASISSEVGRVVVVAGPLTINLLKGRCWKGRHEVDMSPQSRDLLVLLAANYPEAVSDGYLINHLRLRGGGETNFRALRERVTTLRKILDPPGISGWDSCVHRVADEGYMLVDRVR